MERFEFSDYGATWPEWFVDMIKNNKARVAMDYDPAYDDDDDYWQEDLRYFCFACLWTPDGIAIAYEGNTIVNHGTYCEPEQTGL